MALLMFAYGNRPGTGLLAQSHIETRLRRTRASPDYTVTPQGCLPNAQAQALGSDNRSEMERDQDWYGIKVGAGGLQGSVYITCCALQPGCLSSATAAQSVIRRQQQKPTSLISPPILSFAR